MLSYCLKCKKNSKQNPMVVKRKNENCLYQTVPFVVVESRNLSKSKNPDGY